MSAPNILFLSMTSSCSSILRLFERFDQALCLSCFRRCQLPKAQWLCQFTRICHDYKTRMWRVYGVLFEEDRITHRRLFNTGFFFFAGLCSCSCVRYSPFLSFFAVLLSPPANIVTLRETSPPSLLSCLGMHLCLARSLE